MHCALFARVEILAERRARLLSLHPFETPEADERRVAGDAPEFRRIGAGKLRL
jgi:hypothetical protein